MEGGKTANYWPGFVDALTNVVIAMVFVIVVLAIALSFAAQLMGKKMAEQMIAQHVAATAAAASAAAAAPPAPAQAPAVRSDLKDTTRIAVQGNEATASAPSARVRGTAKQLQLDFADTALTLDATALDRVREVLAPMKAQAARVAVQIVAIGPALQLSENQRSAYVRVMAVRNELLDQGYAAERISVRIDTEREAPRSAVLVSITVP